MRLPTPTGRKLRVHDESSSLPYTTKPQPIALGLPRKGVLKKTNMNVASVNVSIVVDDSNITDLESREGCSSPVSVEVMPFLATKPMDALNKEIVDEENKESIDEESHGSLEEEDKSDSAESRNVSDSGDQAISNEAKVAIEDDVASTCSTKSTVSFGSVHVREYERVIDPSLYMGLTLGWMYNEKTPAELETKPESNIPAAISAKAPPPGQDVNGENARTLRKKRNERYELFLNYGYSRKQLKQVLVDPNKFMQQQQRDAARQLMIQDSAKQAKPKRRFLFRGSFR